MRRIALAFALIALSACSPAKKSGPDSGVSAEAQKNEAAGAAFLAKNAMQPGVMTTASGLQYKIVREGPANGYHPKGGDDVKVNYEGTLLDGTVFDSSYTSGQPAVFRLNTLISAWIEGIGLMKPGDEFMLYAPAKLAYGDDSPGKIPPGSTLVFKIELLGVLRADGGVAQG